MNIVATFKGGVTTLNIPYKYKQKSKYRLSNFLVRVIIRNVSNSNPSPAQNPTALIPIYFQQNEIKLYPDSFYMLP